MSKFSNLFIVLLTGIFLTACNESSPNKEEKKNSDSTLVNTSHLDYLNIPITFSNGIKASGIYIYAEAPDYHFVTDSDEGFTCVDDVARAAQVYLRHPDFLSDTATQNKTINLIRFILEMQSENGYFYNFLFPGNIINDTGSTSINGPHWWSWRALQTLTEATLLIKNINAELSSRMEVAVNKLVQRIKTDLLKTPVTTKLVSGITVPQWLPSGSATDQSAIIIIGLIPYCEATRDTVMTAYVKKLADGIVMMQQGDSTQFPYSCFLSWENVWHAYGSDQAYALLKAAAFLKDSTYAQKAIQEVANFYPWLLRNGFLSSFSVNKKGNVFEMLEAKKYAQIAYGIRPMVSAAVEAYHLTGEEKYADIAGNIAAWLVGKNEAGKNMYDITTGRCYDGIIGKDSLNYNSGAESTIEALLTLQMVEKVPAIKKAFNKYKK
ncbi:MAG: hypothetical protein ABR503_05420 [Chitinophagaceae bacterium]